MLRTYNCEVEVCTSATEAMHYDVRTMSLEKMGLKVYFQRSNHVLFHSDNQLSQRILSSSRSFWRCNIDL